MENYLIKKSYAYTREKGSQKEVPELRKLPNNIYRVSGYQGYAISQNKFVEISHIHYLKYQIIRPYLSLYDSDKEIIDIGCSAGAIGIQCLFDDFEKVNFLDHDSEYIEVIDECLGHIKAKSAKTYISKVGEFKGVFEIGFAFALIHWIYSYSEKIGNLDAVIKLLNDIAPETLFIEWVASNDPAIKEAKHLSQNKEIITDSYTRENFVKALSIRYQKVIKIGDVSKTREIWYASNKPVSPPRMIIIISLLKIFFSKVSEKISKKIKKISQLI